MKVEDIARAYTACIELEDRARVEVPNLVDGISELRADLHALLMEALRENHIPFNDRSHAAEIAFQMTRNLSTH